MTPARTAANEIADLFQPGFFDDLMVEGVAAIISKHFPSELREVSPNPQQEQKHYPFEQVSSETSPCIPADGIEYTHLSQVPRPLLEEWYMAQMHYLVAACRASGGEMRLPQNVLRDTPPKSFRLMLMWDLETQDLLVKAEEVK